MSDPNERERAAGTLLELHTECYRAIQLIEEALLPGPGISRDLYSALARATTELRPQDAQDLLTKHRERIKDYLRI